MYTRDIENFYTKYTIFINPLLNIKLQDLSNVTWFEDPTSKWGSFNSYDLFSKGQKTVLIHFAWEGFSFNPLPNNKILDKSKLKAFADDKIEFDEIMIFVFDRVENIVGKGENTFSSFPTMFSE